eukprot:6685317-Heterocapsa_arctica.AAC.1
MRPVLIVQRDCLQEAEPEDVAERACLRCGGNLKTSHEENGEGCGGRDLGLHCGPGDHVVQPSHLPGERRSLCLPEPSCRSPFEKVQTVVGDREGVLAEHVAAKEVRELEGNVL